MTKLNLWTVCQHSAWVGKRDPTFEHGLEEKAITNTAELRAVQKVGGRVFDDYIAASDYADSEAYQPNNAGLVPRAPGTFAGSLCGFPIYQPKGDAHG